VPGNDGEQPVVEPFNQQNPVRSVVQSDEPQPVPTIDGEGQLTDSVWSR
jgi:hypothetical protein